MAEMDKNNGSKMFLVFLKTLLKDFAQIEDAALENAQKCEIIENAFNSKDFTPLIPLWNEIALEDGHVDPPRIPLFESFLKEFQHNDPEWFFWFFDGSSEKRSIEYANYTLPFLFGSLANYEDEFNWDKEFDGEEFIEWCKTHNLISYVPDIGIGAYFLWRSFPRFHTNYMSNLQAISENTFFDED